ncbi:hypothetical protein [Nocardioides albus]|uniref:Uncharacterized protein n=1 Tax=Nocardioides albus TaxID=1841 RepID=A0A7W5F7L2_9ACTN|nr:hypothetical protein [Nocardioides albus]MBB3088284.1 hypothetical protein [Nocardioides albus]GGU42526.1 hypothetical protein GCM10007979_47230 [Nocardioides albus]
MRLPDDDELYEVDQTYLGPPRRYIGEMRYRTIFLFLVIAPVTLVLLRKLGMPVTLLSMGLWLLGASYLSMKASDYISAESSAGAWLMTFWHELTTPRVETGAQYAGGAAVAFRHATSPRGGWAKAMRRPGRRFAQQPGTAASPSLLQATVVASKQSTASRPVRGKAAPVRPVIEAKVVEEPLPAKLTVQPEVQPATRQQAGGGRPAKGGWSSRPTTSPREPRDVPWKGGAPWQARQETTGEKARSARRGQPAAVAEQAEAAAPTRPTAPRTPQAPATESATPTAPPAPPVTPPVTPQPAPPVPQPAPPAPRSAPHSAPPPSPAQAPAQAPAPSPAPRSHEEPAQKAARLPLSHAVRPAVVIAPEPGFDEFDDEPSGRTRPREDQDAQASPDGRRQSMDDYRKRLDGDAPDDGGTA